MFGKRLSKMARLVATEIRDPTGKFDLGGAPWDIDASGHQLVSQSLSSYALSFYIDNMLGADDVCLVDGRLPIDKAGSPVVNPEDFGNVMPAGSRGWVGPFSALNGPFHICRIAAAVANVADVPTRYSVELDQKAT